MADPFVAEIRIFPFTFPPTGWAHCNGQLLPISQNTALFALLGTTYGGDGKSTFGLPDLRSAAPMQAVEPGGLGHALGEEGGSTTVTLLESEITAHTHTLMASTGAADLQSPGPNRVLARSAGGNAYHAPSNLAATAPESLGVTGGGLPHNNMQPYLTLHFNIALQGVFPPRS